MKARHTMLVTALVAGISFAGGISAQDPTDFSGYTTDELVQMRSQVRNMSEEDQIRYRTEMQQRSRDMTPEQRAATDMGPHAGQGAGQGQGQGQGDQRRDGTGDQARSRAGDQTRDRSADQRRDGSGGGQGRGRKKGGGSDSSSNFGARSSYGSGYQSRQGHGGGRGGRGGY